VGQVWVSEFENCQSMSLQALTQLPDSLRHRFRVRVDQVAGRAEVRVLGWGVKDVRVQQVDYRLQMQDPT